MVWMMHKNQNGSSELKHYGVKGMKWGVRKDRETSSKTGITAAQLIAGRDKKDESVDQTIRRYYEKDERLGKAYANIVGANSLRGNNRKFIKFEEELNNGSSERDPNLDKFLKNYKEKTGETFTFSSYIQKFAEVGAKKNPSDDEWSDLERMNYMAGELIDYFASTYSNIPDISDEVDKLNSELRIKMRTELEKALKDAGIIMNSKQRVTITWEEGYADQGIAVFIYNDGMGHTYRAQSTELSSLVSRIKSDAEELNKIQNSTKREKNVDPSAKPVTLTKRERTDTEKEAEKKQSVAPKGSKSTLLSDTNAVNKEIRKIQAKSAINAIKKTTISSMSETGRKYVENAKKAAESKTVKATLKRTISSVGSAIEKGAKAFGEFMQNPFNIQKKTTTTYGGGEHGGWQ